MPAIIIGIVLTVLVIVAQTVLPFAFDFVTTLAVYAAGVFVGRASKK
jgi:hypothetical protein